MSDNTIRLKPRQPLVAIDELTMLVVVAGDPSAARAFTAAEETQAHSYAAEKNGQVVPLPIVGRT